MRARRTRVEASVTITTSAGVRDLDHCVSRSVPLHDVVALRSRDLAIHIPTTDVDDRVLTFIRSWPETLHTLGLGVSTGPVVAFRALEFLHEATNGAKEAPLLWLQHVRKMDIRWPVDGSNKRQYIASNA